MHAQGIILGIYRQRHELALFIILAALAAFGGFPVGLTTSLLVGYAVLMGLIHIPGLRYGVRFGLADIRREPLRLGFVLVACVLLLMWGMSLRGVVLWCVFLAWLVYAWDIRVIYFFAFGSLSSSLVLLIFHRVSWAEITAIYAYLFLVIIVSLQITHFKWHEQKR